MVTGKSFFFSSIVVTFTILDRDLIFLLLSSEKGRFWLNFDVFVSFYGVSSLRAETLFPFPFTPGPK
jgi:hypothetical protein